MQRNIPRGGRPVFATNTSGAKVWEASYLPFGRVHTTIGTPINLRFPGQWFQSETGLHQNWMRDYDPTTGRYMQADPLGLVDGASVYGYALQNPGRYVDVSGMRIDPSDPYDLCEKLTEEECGTEVASLKQICKNFKRLGPKHIALMIFCAIVGEDPAKPRNPRPPSPPTTTQVDPPKPPTPKK